MMVSINGPTMATWNASKYVITWLKAGGHVALGNVTGLPKKVIALKRSEQLFD